MSVPFDVSDAFGDDLMDTFEVIRRPITVNEHGRTVVQRVSMGPQRGLVAPSGTTDLVVTSDYQTNQNTTLVITQFPLYYEAPGHKPDLVVYGGDTFVVGSIQDYTAFGEGFVSAVVTATRFGYQDDDE